MYLLRTGGSFTGHESVRPALSEAVHRNLLSDHLVAAYAVDLAGALNLAGIEETG